MGYRSEVLIRIKHPDPTLHKQMMIDLFLRQLPWVEGIKKDFMEDDASHWNDTEILIYGNDWTWHDTYADVILANTMWAYFEEAAETYTELAGCYIRIGEESDDIVEDYIGDGSELGRAESSIYWDNSI